MTTINTTNNILSAIENTYSQDDVENINTSKDNIKGKVVICKEQASEKGSQPLTGTPVMPKSDKKLDCANLASSLDSVSSMASQILAIVAKFASEEIKTKRTQIRAKQEEKIAKINEEADKLNEKASKIFTQGIVSGTMQILSGAISIGQACWSQSNLNKIMSDNKEITNLQASLTPGGPAQTDIENQISDLKGHVTELTERSKVWEAGIKSVSDAVGAGEKISSAVLNSQSVGIDAEMKQIEAEETKIQAEIDEARAITEDLKQVLEKALHAMQALEENQSETIKRINV